MLVYSVSQVTSYLKESLEQDSLLGNLWVSGEISNFSRSAAGHVYFTLKDSETQLKCVMFRNGNGIDAMANGLAIVAHGRISLYEIRGELQFYTDFIRLEGIGELHLEMEQLKGKLEAEGLFDVSRKRTVPKFPQRIVVMTSPTGAVWQDIQTVIKRRFPIAEVSLIPCVVQGEQSVPSILEAFRSIQNEPVKGRTIILARGGGSIEELWPFNQEAVARAIYASPIPVISAIGHETDYTIADLVADLRAPTPSAAAELAVPDSQVLFSQLFHYTKRITERLQRLIDAQKSDVLKLAERLSRNAPNCDRLMQQIDDMLHNCHNLLATNLTFQREKLNSNYYRLMSLEPNAVLNRGYAVLEKESTGRLLSNLNDISVEDKIKIYLHDGDFNAKVTGKSL